MKLFSVASEIFHHLFSVIKEVNHKCALRSRPGTYIVKSLSMKIHVLTQRYAVLKVQLLSFGEIVVFRICYCYAQDSGFPEEL